MTTTVIVEAHCPDDTEVVFGLTIRPLTDGDDEDLAEVAVLQNGERHTKSVYADSVAVVYEREKAAAEAEPEAADTAA